MANRGVIVIRDPANDAILTYVGRPDMSEAEMTDEIIKLANGMKCLIEKEAALFLEN